MSDVPFLVSVSLLRGAPAFGHLCQTFCLAATWLGLAPFCTMALADSTIEYDLKIDGVTESIIYVPGLRHSVPSLRQGNMVAASLSEVPVGRSGIILHAVCSLRLQKYPAAYRLRTIRLPMIFDAGPATKCLRALNRITSPRYPVKNVRNLGF
jgi:hypothetical protein